MRPIKYSIPYNRDALVYRLYPQQRGLESLRKILIIGANSAIAKATARLYAQANDSLFLLGRDVKQLAMLKADLEVRGAASVDFARFDALQFASHEALIEQAVDALGHIDIVLISHGSLPDQSLCERDFDAALEAFNINALSVISLLTHVSRILVQQQNACIAVVTSVAGVRGRQSNFVYGAAKAMVSTYLQGLRGRLFPHNVNVVDIKPGFVDSPMTAHLSKGALWAMPDQIAERIVRGIEKKHTTVYAPGFWRLIMIIVSSVPEFVFKRLKI